MSIFRRREHTEVEQSKAVLSEASAQEGQSEQSASRPLPPPGVVPPPATPIYSMRQPAPVPRADAEIARSVVREPQLRVREDVGEPAPIARRANRLARRVAPTNVGAYIPPSTRTAGAAQGGALQPHHTFDPIAATQAGLLNVAWRWQEAGAPIRAIHAYFELLHRYPDSAGADAAVADLVELSDKLAGTGQFHLALSIYEHLEHLLA